MRAFVTLVATLVLSGLFAALEACHASPLEDSYIAARDRYIAKFEKYDEERKTSRLDERLTRGDPDANAEADRISEEHKQALADLQKLLQRIVGPLPVIKGVSKSASISLESLRRGDLGYGMVDGLVFRDKKNKTALFVTTEYLVQRWINKNKDTPQDLPGALTSESVLTSIFFGDAYASRFIDIPVARPASARVAVAVAIRSTQDRTGERAPENIVVSVVRFPRVFVLSTPISVNAEISVCNKIWKGLEERRASGSIYKTEDEALKAFHRCYAGRAKSQSFFAAMVKQAQALADLLGTGGASGEN